VWIDESVRPPAAIRVFSSAFWWRRKAPAEPAAAAAAALGQRRQLPPKRFFYLLGHTLDSLNRVAKLLFGDDAGPDPGSLKGGFP